MRGARSFVIIATTLLPLTFSGCGVGVGLDESTAKSLVLADESDCQSFAAVDHDAAYGLSRWFQDAVVNDTEGRFQLEDSKEQIPEPIKFIDPMKGPVEFRSYEKRVKIFSYQDGGRKLFVTHINELNRTAILSGFKVNYFDAVEFCPYVVESVNILDISINPDQPKQAAVTYTRTWRPTLFYGLLGALEGKRMINDAVISPPDQSEKVAHFERLDNTGWRVRRR